MNAVSVTRMELLARKAQIALAKQGRELLEQKRSALLKEFLRTADVALVHSEALQQASDGAHQSLARAEGMAGAQQLHSVALAARSELSLEVTSTSVMGVRVPQIEQRRVGRSIMGRGYSIVGASTSIDETASAFESEVEAIIQLAETELRLTRLGAEIQSTSRRLNALENLLIPRLESECEFIQIALDERERADHFRFKLMKRIMERKRGGEFTSKS